MALLQNLLTLTFAVSSMFAMGLAHTPREVLAPLRSAGLVAPALLCNFVIVPGVALLISRAMPNPDFAAGLVLLGAAAGAPSAIKLAELAEGDLALATGLLVLLVVGTVVYLPLVLPLAIRGVEVDGGTIAVRLALQLLVPLALGLAVRARYEGGAASLLPPIQKIANVSLALLLAVMILMNVGDILAMVGTGAIFAVLLMVSLAVASGWLLGGAPRERRATLAVTSGMRNAAAAFVVATGSFAARPDVIVFLAGAALLDLAAMFLFAGELRRRRRRAAERDERAPEGAAEASPA